MRKNGSEISRKAWRTIKWLKTVQARYGRETAQVVRLLDRGADSAVIEDALVLPRTSVAAYKANYTRGTYGFNPNKA